MLTTANRANDLDTFHKAHGGTDIANASINRDRAIAAVTDGRADLVSFGAPFVANPDPAGLLAAGAELNRPAPVTPHGGDHRGYTDYLPRDPDFIELAA